MKKRICFLLNNPFLFDNRVEREAESLVKAGYDLHLIALKSRDATVPIQENRNGIQVHRLFRKHLPNYSPLSINFIRSILAILTTYRRFDLVHSHDINTLLIGWLLARLWRAKLVYDSHELWESLMSEKEKKLLHLQALNKPGTKSFLSRKLRHLKQMRALENWIIRHSDAIVSVSEPICEILRAKAQNRPPYCVPIRNIPMYFHLPREKTSRLFHDTFQLPADTRIVLYQGWIMATRGMAQLLDAMERMDEEGIALILMGPAEPEYLAGLLKRIQSSPRLRKRVFYKQAVPGSELLNWTASADLGIAPILNCKTSYYYCLPNKLFEYIQAGIPAAVSDLPEMRQVVEKYDVGFTFDPENPGEIADKVQNYFASRELQERYARNILGAKASLNWENEEKQLIALYHHLLGETHPVAEPIRSLSGQNALGVPGWSATGPYPARISLPIRRSGKRADPDITGGLGPLADAPARS